MRASTALASSAMRSDDTELVARARGMARGIGANASAQPAKMAVAAATVRTVLRMVVFATGYVLCASRRSGGPLYVEKKKVVSTNS